MILSIRLTFLAIIVVVVSIAPHTLQGKFQAGHQLAVNFLSAACFSLHYLLYFVWLLLRTVYLYVLNLLDLRKFIGPLGSLFGNYLEVIGGPVTATPFGTLIAFMSSLLWFSHSSLSCHIFKFNRISLLRSTLVTFDICSYFYRYPPYPCHFHICTHYAYCCFIHCSACLCLIC